MRYWCNKKEDDGSIHAIGNGWICAYGQGPDFIQVFGAPHSLPSILSLSLACEEKIETESSRSEGSTVWNHRMRKNGSAIGEMTDFTMPGKPCLIRSLDLTSELVFCLSSEKDPQIQQNDRAFEGLCTAALLFTARAGTYFYADLYSAPCKTFYQVCLRGNIRFEQGENAGSFLIRCLAGHSEIVLCGGTDYSRCVDTCQQYFQSDGKEIVDQTIQAGRAYTSKRFDFTKQIPDCFPDKENLCRVIDDISMLIYSQTDQNGFILAGHQYHLAYVRDQFGVIRCLLELGYFDEVRRNLLCYFDVWKRYGKINNACSLGFDGIFHVHENDEAEITGYLIIQALEYYEKTGDAQTIDLVMPMLKWAFEAQVKHEKGFMLPFNGDETYVAGGLLPRSALNDGSAEATMLFIRSGDLLLNYPGQHGSWDKLAEYRDICAEVREHFHSNFIVNGEFITNNPTRKKFTTLPAHRHGVCERCNAFGFTSKNKNDRYLCVSCFESENFPRAEDKMYSLLSVGLAPAFLGIDVPGAEETGKILDEIMSQYEKTGKLPSGSDSNNSVGYEYGFLLYALTKRNHPKAMEIYQKMMSLPDQTGAWVEYYAGGKPSGTRCRPWESGISLSAAIRFAISFDSVSGFDGVDLQHC